MSVALVMREVRNYFPALLAEGDFSLSAGTLSDNAGAKAGDWVVLCGSDRSDGVYRLNDDALIPGAADESWTGQVWVLHPPAEFIALCAEIDAWLLAHPPDGILSERFGEYARANAPAAGSEAVSWREAFAGRLLPWRRMFTEVNCRC